MIYPQAYTDFLAHFNGTKDFFECHEVLEEYWKETTPCHRESVWVWLIQFAVSLYHYRRGNENGAIKLLKRLERTWNVQADNLESLGLHAHDIKITLTEVHESLRQKKPYYNVNISILDSDLQAIVHRKCLYWNVPYNRETDPGDYFLTHKHKLRDRHSSETVQVDQLSQK
ncbi:DUF309 domain-containing protein [Thalassobacillus devorans]|uniref:DUF309 domain-containing protein n=1 Tax=Thalassobacillus devorans TaxID=279813 RepID=UPI001592F34D|nr:DUF309 domain-containing protein [Thalassobacillus devorans]